MIDKNLQVELGDWVLDNPIIPASGTFGYGHEHTKFYDINILGSFSTKGTTRYEKFGNELPRIAECEFGLLNSIGLQNPGIDNVIKYEFEKLKKVFNKKIIVNISATTIEEFIEMIQLLNDQDIVEIIELNVSCPNVKKGNKNFSTDKESLTELVKEAKKISKKKIYVKLAPMVSNIVEIAIACEMAGADGLSMINTLPGMKIDLNSKKPLLANKFGGYSGQVIKPVAIKIIYEVYKKVRIPIIGIGGISNANDVLEMMLVGASAVQIGTANLIDPYACQKIIQQLPIAMKKYGINNLSEIIGKVKDE